MDLVATLCPNSYQKFHSRKSYFREIYARNVDFRYLSINKGLLYKGTCEVGKKMNWFQTIHLSHCFSCEWPFTSLGINFFKLKTNQNLLNFLSMSQNWRIYFWIRGKRLISRPYQEFYKLNSKIKNNNDPNIKQPKDMKMHFPDEDKCMVNNQMKRDSAPSSIKGKQIKTTMSYHSTLTRMD